MKQLLFVFTFLISIVSASNEPPLNIILIMADDLGYETLTANGGESYQTPRLDQLAAKGARFEHCYAQPVCTSSRVKIMTGLSNVRNYTWFGNLNHKQKTFAHYLKKAGYATAIAGKWQLGGKLDYPKHFGFDEELLWQHKRSRFREGTRHDSRFENPVLEQNNTALEFNKGEYAPDLFTDYLCDFMTRKKDEPFFAYYPMVLAHCPFAPTPDSKDWDPESKGSLTYLGSPQYFGDMVSYMDKLVGRIVDHVESLGIADRTVILFTGDNGTDQPITSLFQGRAVQGGKLTTKDSGTRVPLIAYAPGLIKPMVVQDLVDLSDFLPTMCDIAGIKSPNNIDGQSFWPQLRGETGSPREWVYCWYSRSGKTEDAQVFARTQKYKVYATGEFYDIPRDVDELNPLVNLTQEQIQIKEQLTDVIKSYAKYRPENQE